MPLAAYTNAVVYTGNEILRDMAVLARDGVTLSLVRDSDIPAEAEVHDLGGHCLAPSLIDLQIYGGNGKLFAHELSVESLEQTYQYCLQGGCSHFLITIATNSDEVIFNGMDTIRQYWQNGGKGLLGLHLEGPYINPEKKGAHLEKYIKRPTVEEIDKLLAAGKEVLKIITLAPETCDEAVLERLLANNIIVSAGHSNATYPQAMQGFDSGISLATHLFNAMSPLQGRQPGMTGAIYDHDKVMSSIVADGVHVDYASVRISKKIMGERLFLITDAVTEIKEGVYHHLFAGDRYVLPDGTLSGSALTMMKAVSNLVNYCGIDLAEALRMATAFPAKAVGRAADMGYIQPGYEASYVVFDTGLHIISVIDQSGRVHSFA